MYHQSKVTDKTVRYIILFVTVLALVVATPVMAASKSSSGSKSKSKTKAKTTAKCDVNYEKCVPVASDVDCKPGSGNGPKYLSSAKKVLKKDVYKLDSDKDKIACERN